MTVEGILFLALAVAIAFLFDAVRGFKAKLIALEETIKEIREGNEKR